MSIDTIASKSKGTFEEELNNWIGREKAAIKLMSIIGTLRFDRAVELIIFRNQLHDCNVGEILAYHEYARKMVNKPISIFDSLEIAEGLTRMNLAPAKLDLGKLAHEWLEAKEKGAKINYFEDAKKAAQGADVLIADTWFSMGQKSAEDEKLKQEKLAQLTPYKITQELMNVAAPTAIFTHCLPAYRGIEVDAEVIDGARSIVFDEAENRLHAQKAVLLWCFDLI